MKLALRLVIAVLILCLLTRSTSSRVQGRADGSGTLSLLTTVDVGGSPDTIVVDTGNGRNDVVFYDRSAGKVRFLDGDTLTMATETISIPTWAWEGWMAYDRHHHRALLVTTKVIWSTPYDSWQEARVHTISERTLQGSFSVNADFNTDPTQLADENYAIDGLAFKQPGAEGNNPGRLILDNTRNGNIDVVDLDPTGTSATRIQRYSYRAPVTGSGWEGNLGNSLALEPQHETLAVDDLTNADLLYISDKNHANDYGLRAVHINHAPLDLGAIPLPDVDLQNQCGLGGCQGIAMAGQRDRLYVASGGQSFDNGFIDVVNTTNNQLADVMTLTYGDLYFVHVDWSDPQRVFLCTFDHWYNDPQQGLYLHLIYGDEVVDSLQLMENYDEYNGLRGMAFDPQHQRLYLTVGSQVMVVAVDNSGLPPALTPQLYLPVILTTQ